MSEDTKGRTMIGTVAPRSTPQVSNHAAPTIAHAPSAGAPTVGLRSPTSSAQMPPVGDPNDPEALVGQELCGYRIRRKLAEGGMGVVYEGEHTKIGRLGAIKVLKPEFCRADDVVERFYQEARAVNAIHHDNIVDIYDFGRDSFGRVFFVMEYLEGEPLSHRIGRGALTWSEAFPILDQTIRALKAAHDKGFVHRDLKPDNIWLRQVGGKTQVKLLDFGIAKLVGSDSPQDRLTRTGSVIGTPHYMSPEQINGAKGIDQRTDIYALGVIMYEMFAGVTPFVGDTLQAIMTGHLFKEAPRLAEIPHDLGVPPPIAEVVDRMLVKDAAARYDNVADVLGDLYDINGNRTPTKADTLNRERPTRAPTAILSPAAIPAAPARKRGGLIAIGVIGAAAVAGVAVWATRTEPVATKPPVVVPPTVTGPEPIKITTPTPTPIIDRELARKDAQATLHSSLEQPELGVRIEGARTIGDVKDQTSLPALIDHTKSESEDQEVRGNAAEAIGKLGGADAPRALLGKLEAAAPAGLKVWYDAGLARLGDPAARRRLAKFARDKDIGIALTAGLALADLSKPGDKPTVDILQALAKREKEIDPKEYPYAGITILGRAAALHDRVARDSLYTCLHNTDLGIQIAAATELARIGDDAGKQVLHDAVAKATAPNNLLAAVGQIPLGEYGGSAILLKALADKDSVASRIKAAQGLGATGELDNNTTLNALLAQARADKDWTVRVAVAGAILQIVGLDPLVLAQASVDWTQAALRSPDTALRKAAAGVLADIPSKQAMPLLAAAFADQSPDVRIAASKSAGKIKSAEAAAKVVDAVKTETNLAVKEQQVKALGQIGTVASAAAHDTLAQIAEQPGRIGVFAAGSLIAVGDTAGAAKLEQAVGAPQVDIRLAAVEAASAAGNQVVVPTLKRGVLDKIFNIRFTAAEGLAAYMDPIALPILTAARDTSPDPDVIGRALAALTRLGQPAPTQGEKSPAELIQSPVPKIRLAAIPIVRVMPPAEGLPLLRRLIADQDPDVRHASVDAIADVVTKDKDQAIKLYRPLVNDADLIVRNKASGQLSRLVPTPPAPPPPTDTKTAQTGPDPKLLAAIERANKADKTADTAGTELAAADKEMTATLTGTKHDATTITTVRDIAAKGREQADALTAAANEAEAGVKDAIAAAGASPTPDVAQQIADAQKVAEKTKAAAAAAQVTATKLKDEARKYGDRDVIAALPKIKTEISSGHLAEAERDLRTIKAKLPEVDDTYGALYLAQARAASTPADQRKLYQRAKDAYQRVVQSGGGLARQATGAIADIDNEVSQIAP